jgi:hypothetical protein
LLRFNSRLEELDLSHNGVSCEGLRALAEALAGRRDDGGLKRLVLCDNRIGDQGVRDFCRIVATAGPARLALMEVVLAFNPSSAAAKGEVRKLLETLRRRRASGSGGKDFEAPPKQRPSAMLAALDAASERAERKRAQKQSRKSRGRGPRGGRRARARRAMERRRRARSQAGAGSPSSLFAAIIARDRAEVRARDRKKNDSPDAPQAAAFDADETADALSDAWAESASCDGGRSSPASSTASDFSLGLRLDFGTASEFGASADGDAVSIASSASWVRVGDLGALCSPVCSPAHSVGGESTESGWQLC